MEERGGVARLWPVPLQPLFQRRGVSRPPGQAMDAGSGARLQPAALPARLSGTPHRAGRSSGRTDSRRTITGQGHRSAALPGVRQRPTPPERGTLQWRRRQPLHRKERGFPGYLTRHLHASTRRRHERVRRRLPGVPQHHWYRRAGQLRRVSRRPGRALRRSGGNVGGGCSPGALACPPASWPTHGSGSAAPAPNTAPPSSSNSSCAEAAGGRVCRPALSRWRPFGNFRR